MEYEMSREEIEKRQHEIIKEENAQIIRGLLMFACQKQLTKRDLSAINKSVKELKKRGIIPIDNESVKEAVML